MPQALTATPTTRAGQLVREGAVLARASFSSFAATVLDGIAYQGVLFATDHYTAAAVVGALVGGVSNFLINRHWAFPKTSRSVWRQAWLYAGASGLVYVGFQSSLMLFIEVLHVNTRLAWFPAQVIAWMIISYPLFRFVVFAKPRAESRAAFE